MALIFLKTSLLEVEKKIPAAILDAKEHLNIMITFHNGKGECISFTI